jgi:hypothetical protein
VTITPVADKNAIRQNLFENLNLLENQDLLENVVSIRKSAFWENSRRHSVKAEP